MVEFRMNASSDIDPQLGARVRSALLAAIRHAMEATCGFCPSDGELEEAVQTGLACLTDPSTKPGAEADQ
jgi:hypothetical protein